MSKKSKSPNVVILPGVAAPAEYRKEKSKSEDILADAYGADLLEVVVIGVDRQGNLYFDGTHDDGPNVLWLMRQAEQVLINPPEEW